MTMSPIIRGACALAGAALLAACGGGGATSAVPRAGNTPLSWLAVLRYVPTDVQLSLQSARTAYMYVDAGATNGAYPPAADFAAQMQAANPGLASGACSRIARISASVMTFTDTSGVQAPSYVIFFQPVATGTCTQPIDLGATGMSQFSVTVTP